MSQAKQIEKEEQNTHFVYISNEDGIFAAFNQVKKELAKNEQTCLSLVYFVLAESNQPLFKTELGFLEKRFYHKLLVYYAALEPNAACLKHEFLEVIINSNINKEMQFLAFGNADFVDQVTEQLIFLGIKPNQINSHYIKF
jgi:hypothetical protein